jgi:nucleoside phosphorylase/CheY-like chemotaxis protein
MIRTLIVDDDTTKVTAIRDALATVPEMNIDEVAVAEDLITARDMVRTRHFDLLILDIRLPNRKGDDVSDSAACEFIKELNASQTLLRPYHIIGLTAYDDLLAKVDPFFYDQVWRVVKYDPKTADWKSQLTRHIRYLVQSKKELIDASNLPYSYDVAVVTALVNPELSSVLELPGGWQELHHWGDGTIYYAGTFSDTSKRLKVVAASAHQMGMTAAAVLSMKVHKHFRPRYLVMTGIAAGVAGGDGNPGDILVAEQTWDYQSGKSTVVKGKGVFQPDPKSIPLNTELKERFLQLASNRLWLDDIKREYQGKTPPSPLNVLVGPVASGDTVIQNENIVRELRGRNRKLVGIDMETYGVFYAAENCPQPRPTPISIKSICDFADAQKADDFQKYASYVSARYFYRYALHALSSSAR